MKKEYSKNLKAEQIVRLRDENGISVDFPCEYDYHCPVCKYELCVDGNYDERLEWSEYECFLWCSVCNRDYPTCLCVPDIGKAIDVYLECVKIHKNGK
jgi:hypothetical protein